MTVEESKMKYTDIIIENVDIKKGAGHFLLMMSYAVQLKFSQCVIRIDFDESTVIKEEVDEGAIKEVYTALFEELKSSHSELLESFAKAKYYLDKLFYDLTEQGYITYLYDQSHLISSEEVRKQLGISRPTLSRYVERGLETTNAKSHKSYPSHVVFYWKDGKWVSRIQTLFQLFKLRNRTQKDVIKELELEDKKYRKLYGNKPFSEVFLDVVNPDDLKEPEDYYNWKDIVEELQEVKNDLSN